MPSKTPKQKSFMAAVANNPKFAKKVGVPSKVGKEFEMKDKKMGMKKMADKAGRAMTKKSADTMGSCDAEDGQGWLSLVARRRRCQEGQDRHQDAEDGHGREELLTCDRVGVWAL